MKLVSYSRFGTDWASKEVIFKTDDDCTITFTFGTLGEWTLETDGATMDDVLRAYKDIENGLINV